MTIMTDKITDNETLLLEESYKILTDFEYTHLYRTSPQANGKCSYAFKNMESSKIGELLEKITDFRMRYVKFK